MPVRSRDCQTSAIDLETGVADCSPVVCCSSPLPEPASEAVCGCAGPSTCGSGSEGECGCEAPSASDTEGAVVPGCPASPGSGPERAAVCPPVPAVPKVQCPSCGKFLSIRVLSEKHRCERKPRIPWKMDPESLLERRKVAAIRRFEKRAARGRTSCVQGEAAGCPDVDVPIRKECIVV